MATKKPQRVSCNSSEDRTKAQEADARSLLFHVSLAFGHSQNSYSHALYLFIKSRVSLFPSKINGNLTLFAHEVGRLEFLTWPVILTTTGASPTQVHNG
jgi:hypothetical protein